MKKKNIVQVDMEVDVSKLQKVLIDNPSIFGDYDERIVQEDSPHRDSSDVWVRYGDIDRFGNDVILNEHESVWYPVLDKIPEVLPIVYKIMAKVHGERLGGVLITKLPKGKKIYSHVDTLGWHPNYYDKFYVPISNKKGSIFGFEGDGDIEAKEGEVYWFRNDVPHWVNNYSDEDRIAMVVCIKPFSGIKKEVSKVDFNTVHHYNNGIYSREMTLPKGWRAESHKHKFSHMSILASGVVGVRTDEGENIYKAPAVLDIKAGISHEIFALEDSVWFCIHETDEINEDGSFEPILIEEV